MNRSSKFSNWLRNSITARMLIVGFLLVILLIPLEFVKSLITERSFRQQEVTHEINDKWGNAVTLMGPILKIPYRAYIEEEVYNKKNEEYNTRTKEVIRHAFFFPESLDIKANIDAKPLNRGIYESIVYTSDIDIQGTFSKIDLSKKDIEADDILWDKAVVLLKTSNLKGIKNNLSIQLQNTAYDLTPKYAQSSLGTLSTAAFTLANTASDLSFSLSTKINGSERLAFIPVGKITEVAIESNWHSPSFSGMFLPEPENKSINDDGFKAQWTVSQINRPFEQLFLNNLPDLDQYAFGTDLYIPVDEYQKSERSSKYGFMVIGITLLVFLLIQIVSKIYIHPFQYLMIGLALVLFYTLLISISEHSSFFKAYMIAGGAVLGLITLYSQMILKGFKFPLLICTSLAALYGFIYVIIQLENYALLVGSIGLFVILAIIMFASRKIDWHNEN